MSGQLDLFATTGAASAAPVRASRPPLADRASRNIEPLPFVSDPLIDAALSGRTLTLRGVSDRGVALATDYVRDGREFGYFDPAARDQDDVPRSEWGDGGPQRRHRGPDSADRAAALAYVYRIAEAATWSWRIARDRDARTVAIRRADLALVDDAARLSRFATSTRRKLTDQQTTTVAAALPLFSGEAAAPVRPNQQPMPRVARTEPTCADCGLTWSEGCDSPDWSWRDEGFVGISACDRCGLNSCLRCRARDGVFSGTLCAACFDLPAMTDAELRMHPDVARGAYSVDAIRERLAWRYAPPTGQRCEISPAVVGFWHDHADGKHKGLTQKQIDALFATASALKYACLEDEDDAE